MLNWQEIQTVAFHPKAAGRMQRQKAVEVGLVVPHLQKYLSLQRPVQLQNHGRSVETLRAAGSDLYFLLESSAEGLNGRCV